MTLAEYSRASVRALIDSVSREAQNAQRKNSNDAIHDLRVAIRRLSENLRVFKDLFPRGSVESVRGDLRAAMKLAGEARNHDIARDLMRRAKVQAAPDLAKGRDEAAIKLSAVLDEWVQSDAAHAWLGQLHV